MSSLVSNDVIQASFDLCENLLKRFPVEVPPPGIFGVPLAESIRYANVAISLTNDHGESFIYGYVPIVVAKCGVFLKEKGEHSTKELLSQY